MNRPLPRFFTLLLVCVLSFSAGANAQSPSSSETRTGPTPYPDPKAAAQWPGEGVIRVFDWMKDNRAYFWKQRQQQQGSWVLAGDSLLGNWRSSQKDLAPVPTANRAIGGDVSRGLLFRFQEDVLDLHPRGVVLLIGGNDLSALQPTDQTARNIGRMLEAIHAQNPSTPVILCTLPPRDSAKAPIKTTELMKLNASIRQLARQHEHVQLLDLHPLFATSEGKIQPALLTDDRLHIGPAGYEVLARELKSRLLSSPSQGT